MKKLHHLEMKNMRFSVFSPNNIRSLSIAKVVTPLLFDPLGHALPGGLYDPKMGKKCVAKVTICNKMIVFQN